MRKERDVPFSSFCPVGVQWGQVRHSASDDGREIG